MHKNFAICSYKSILRQKIIWKQIIFQYSIKLAQIDIIKMININNLHLYTIFIPMSYLIQLEEPSSSYSSSYHVLKQQLRSIFKSKQFNCRNIIDKPFSMTYCLKGSPATYRLSTIWRFSFNENHFSIHIVFYNRQQNDFLRAYTERMKIQLSILCRMVNNQVVPNFSFFVDSQTGLLKMSYTVGATVFFSMDIKKENLLYLIMNLFLQMNKFNQLMIFIEPTFNVKQIKEQRDPNVKINKFRALLRNTKNARKQIQACFNDLIKFKQLNPQLNKGKIDSVSSLYLRNVTNFQKSTLGLADVNQFSFQYDPKIFASQLKQINKNQMGATTRNNSNTQKIISGLFKIEPIDQKQQQVCSKQGAHSFIFKKTFKYYVADTIYQGTINYANEQFMNHIKAYKGQLAYKICNTQNQTSINSFRNEIEALKYMKQMSSPFIARYYLQIKQSWDQKDKIYMNNYRKDVHTLMAKGNKFNIHTKIDIAYKIAKGLCFLSKRQILHRDFKPKNIVVDSKLSPKIIDFGSCTCHYLKQKFKPFDQRLLTTPGYNLQYLQIPPQHHQIRQKYKRNQYDSHPLFDVYGYGRTLSYIFFGDVKPPISQCFLQQPMFEVYEHLIFLINMCTSVDPDDRPGFGQLTAFLGSLIHLTKNQFKDHDSQADMIAEDK